MKRPLRIVNCWLRSLIKRCGLLVMRHLPFAMILPVAFAVALLAWGAQERFPEAPRKESKFTMARVYFESPVTPMFMGPVGRSQGPAWSHDWPRVGRALHENIVGSDKAGCQSQQSYYFFQR